MSPSTPDRVRKVARYRETQTGWHSTSLQLSSRCSASSLPAAVVVALVGAVAALNAVVVEELLCCYSHSGCYWLPVEWRSVSIIGEFAKYNPNQTGLL